MPKERLYIFLKKRITNEKNIFNFIILFFANNFWNDEAHLTNLNKVINK